MIMDASPQCHKVSFDIGSGSSTRSWDIKVTQYSCGQQFGGPDGCLQYFTGQSGTVSSFNFPTTSSNVDTTVTHLSNQNYMMCWRQERGFCAICFVTAIQAGTQHSFGLSNVAADGTVDQSTNTQCNTDYLALPHAENTVTVGTIPVSAADRICGRIFNADASATSQTAPGNSVCSELKTGFFVCL